MCKHRRFDYSYTFLFQTAQLHLVSSAICCWANNGTCETDICIYKLLKSGRNNLDWMSRQAQDKFGNYTEQVPNKHCDALHTDNPNIERLVIAVADQQVSVIQMMERLSLKHRPTFLENYLNPAMDDGFIRQLYPQSPRHPRQKYLLTVKGFALYNKISQNR